MNVCVRFNNICIHELVCTHHWFTYTNWFECTNRFTWIQWFAHVHTWSESQMILRDVSRLIHAYTLADLHTSIHSLDVSRVIHAYTLADLHTSIHTHTYTHSTQTTYTHSTQITYTHSPQHTYTQNWNSDDGPRHFEIFDWRYFCGCGVPLSREPLSYGMTLIELAYASSGWREGGTLKCIVIETRTDLV